MTSKFEGEIAEALAQELGAPCTRLSLKDDPEYLEVFDRLVDYVGLKDDDTGQFGISVDPSNPNSFCDDYYCRRFMGISRRLKTPYLQFSELLLKFDSQLELNFWRRVGVHKKFTKYQAEVFICCSAFSQSDGRTLKQHLAHFFKSCQTERVNLNTVRGCEEAVSNLIKDMLPDDLSANINFTIRKGRVRFENRPYTHRPFIPDNRENQRYDQPSSLLRWDAAVTPFFGRAYELNLLQAWWRESKNLGVSCQLIVGEGGVGKTRLAAEFAKSVRSENWAVGFMKLGDDDYYGTWECGETGILIILDYPEERPHELKDLMSKLVSIDTQGKKLRLLIAGRSKELVQSLSFDGQSLFARSICLQGFRKDSNSGWDVFKSALDAFTEIKLNAKASKNFVKVPLSREDFNEWHNEGVHSRPIFVLALAFYLIDENREQWLVMSDLRSDVLIRYLSNREARLIERQVQGVNKKIDANSRKIDVRIAVLIQAVAAIPGTLDMLSLDCFYEDLADFLMGYTIEDVKAVSKISFAFTGKITSLEPDILAADFLVYALDKYAFHEDSGWILAGLGLRHASKLATESVVSRFHRLGRLVHDSELLTSTSQKKCIWEGRMDQVSKHLQDRPESCYFIADYCLANRVSVHLGALAVSALEYTSKNTSSQNQRLYYLTSIGITYSALGQYEKAMDAFQYVADRYSYLANDDPEKYEASLARSLHDLTDCLLQQGYSENIQEAIQKSLDIHEHLAKINPQEFEPYWARSLHNLSVCLSSLGYVDDAIKAIEKAVHVHERLCQKNPGQYEPGLADSLHCLASRLNQKGKINEALSVIGNAVKTYRHLAFKNPEIYEILLAGSLNNQSNYLLASGFLDESIKSLREALDIYEPFARIYPEKFEISYAGGLYNLCRLLIRKGEFQSALDNIQTAISVFENLTISNASRYEPILIGSRNYLGFCLANTSEVEESIKTFEYIYHRYYDTNYKDEFAIYMENSQQMLVEIMARFKTNLDDGQISRIQVLINRTSNPNKE
ncbi:tetratricopeptide repeat protein [Porticoccus sp. W117]|uniref:tetratricopeptide repeat protein n=1 Tax=Porticoccus sp. W117 TaxID=3054777 RepID=UPI00259ABD37|nr:ATP-binding protein [Porticoccus sp. W117]MDM3871801.1 tetratricopeptide repeat protein [Porticoccus sp. W117]